MSGSGGGCRVWTEARKHERRLKGMMVDYKRRAERRREYYDRIKTDPAQFMQVHGRALKIHIDPSLAAQAEGPSTMMTWQGRDDTIIDRFDVRAHLEVIPEPSEGSKADAADNKPGAAKLSAEESQINYERYRILVQNDFAQVKEHKFLHQIFLEERFGGSSVKKAEQEAEKKKLAEKKAAIGYNYDGDGAGDVGGSKGSLSAEDRVGQGEGQHDGEAQADSEEEFDLDIAFDVDQIPPEQAREMNTLSITYGMIGTEFIDQLVRDKAELEALREAKAVEEERAAGRRNRRDRRRAREQARARDLNTLRTGDAGQTMGLLGNNALSTLPAYAAAEPHQQLTSRADDLLRSEKSSSRSPSPDERGKVCFITSFGGDSGDEATVRRSRSMSPMSRPNSKRSATTTATTTTTTSTASAKRCRLSSPPVRSSQRSASRRSRNGSTSSSSDDSVSSRERRRRRARKNGATQQSQQRHTGRARSTSSSSSSSSNNSSRLARRSRSRSRSDRRSESPHPPAKLPTPPRKSYYRHDLKSDDSAGGVSSPDEDEAASQTSDSKMSKPEYRSTTVDSQLMQHMPAAVQGQILAQSGGSSGDLAMFGSSNSAAASAPGTASAAGAGSTAAAAAEIREELRREEADKRSISGQGSSGNGGGGVLVGAKPPGKLTPQERLRRKMQAMLKKTHQTDQLARMEKEEKAREERMQRQEQLKEHLARYGRTDRRFDSDVSEEEFSPRRRSVSRDRSERDWPPQGYGYSGHLRDGTAAASRDLRSSRSRSRSRGRSRSRSRSRSRTASRSRSRDRRRRPQQPQAQRQGRLSSRSTSRERRRSTAAAAAGASSSGRGASSRSRSRSRKSSSPPPSRERLGGFRRSPLRDRPRGAGAGGRGGNGAAYYHQQQQQQQHSYNQYQHQHYQQQPHREGGQPFGRREEGSSCSRWSRERSPERRVDDRYRDSRGDRPRDRNFGKAWLRDRSPPRRRDDRRMSYR